LAALDGTTPEGITLLVLSLGFLGWLDTNKVVPTGVVPSKVAEAYRLVLQLSDSCAFFTKKMIM
jgi:hypothetical protein